MQNLSIQLTIDPQCKLVSFDNTHYSIDNSIVNYVSLEYLVYYEDKAPIDNTLIFKEYLHNRENYSKNTSFIYFPKDGIFTYYKYVIPKLEKLHIGESFNIKNQVFYHNNHFYYGLENCSNESDATTETYSVKIDNYLDIWDKYIKVGHASETLSYQKRIFSCCGLQKCLVNLQKKILNSSKSCVSCDLDNSIRYRRDFLLSALYVLDYLKDQNNFEEAQRILDNLSSCNSLCGDDLDFNNDCGCGSIKY